MTLPDSDAPLIDRLRRLPETARAAELECACLADSGLRERLPAVATALAAEAPADELTAGAMTRVLESALVAGDLESVGARLGRYELLEKIGEGGFGAVWLAEQHEPVRRRVALKIVKLGMDTREVIARFEVERQALALMEHPNIAQVFDAGATDSGRPYFVMELVRGVGITRYCDEHRLTAEARLQLFLTVCLAVRHAHDKGIIHRDLKPSNILIASVGGAPTPKIIDFGIAKATGARLTDKTLFTQFHAFMGTPAYMSPEQMELGGAEVDQRSDIYSLGVLLYELLAGRLPFDPDTLVKPGLEAMRRTIREIDPPTPSGRLRTLTENDRASVAQQRGTEPAKLSVLLRGDLDWIVMRCLEKDRMRRYESATELAADIERHLRDEVVLARPPSAAYRTQKFYRRHKLVVLASVAVAAALATGLLIPGRSRPPFEAAPIDAKSIAVLPFESMSDDKANAFFTDGVHEDILTNLSNIRELRVVSRTSVERYRGTTKPLKQIGAELGVAYILEGSVQRVGNNVHVTGQLIDARSDRHLWAKSYDKALSNVFAIQAELAKEIAGALQATLTPQEENAIERKHTSNPKAYDLYNEARANRERLGTGNRDSREQALLEQTVELDPTFAEAWAALSVSYGYDYFTGRDQSNARLAQARAALDAARRLAPDSHEILLAAAALDYYQRNFTQSIEEATALVRLYPNDSYAYALIGAASRRLGRWLEFMANTRKALQLDPDNTTAEGNLIDSLAGGQRYAEAEAADRKWLGAHAHSWEREFDFAIRAFEASGSTREMDDFVGAMTNAQANSPAGIEVRKIRAYLTGNLSDYIRLDRLAADKRPDTLGDTSTAIGRWFDQISIVLIASGDVAGGRTRLQEAAPFRSRLESEPENDALLERLARIEALLGNKAEALRLATKAVALRPEALDKSIGPERSLNLAFVYAWTGEKDKAIAEITRLLGIPTQTRRRIRLNIHELKSSPEFFPIKDDPRFQALVNDPANNKPLF